MSFTTNKPALEGRSQPAERGPLSSRDPAPMFRLDLVRSVRMNPLVFLGVAAFSLLAILAYALLLKPMYLASSRVYEQPALPKLLGDSATGVFDAGKYETFLDEQIQTVQRPDVLKTALATLPQSAWSDYGAATGAAVENLQKQLAVARVANSNQMSIELKGSKPSDTADVVNAITKSYLDTAHRATTAESDMREQLLSEEQARIDAQLHTARAEQMALGLSIGVANPAAQGNPYDAELAGVRMQLTEARAAHDAAAAQLATLSGVGAGRGSALASAADEIIAGDAGLNSMQASVSQRRSQLSGQMAGMTATNPIYKQNQDEIADLDQNLNAMRIDLRDKAERRLQAKLRGDLARTGDVEARLNGDLSQQIARATSAAPRLQRSVEVATDITRLEARSAQVDDARRSLRLEAAEPAQVRLAMAATVPEHPEPSRRRLLLLAAMPLALLFGASAAVLMRIRDRRIYDQADMEQVLGFAPIAVLPARGDVAAGVFDEYVLRLAAGIESAYRSSGARTFMLTAVSVSTDIEPLGSALLRKFGEIGVDVAVATASDMLEPTTLAANSHDSAELARRSGGESFVGANIERLKAGHGLVLIESQALANSAQAEYVARCADATILVVECGVTTRDELLEAAALLERLHVTGIGAVMEELQLRYADVNFRRAVEALERRQSGGPRQGFARTGKASNRKEKSGASVPSAPGPVLVKAAPVAGPSVVEEIAEPAVVEEIAEPEAAVDAIAKPEAAVQAVAEPEEFLPAPMVAEEPAPVPAVAAFPSAAPEAAEVPKFEVADANDIWHAAMREKITAMRGPGAGDHMQNEDSGMKPTSWLSQLLHSDPQPEESVLPLDGDPDYAENNAPLEEQASSLNPAHSEEHKAAPTTRPELISRSRPDAHPGETTALHDGDRTAEPVDQTPAEGVIVTEAETAGESELVTVPDTMTLAETSAVSEYSAPTDSSTATELSAVPELSSMPKPSALPQPLTIAETCFVPDLPAVEFAAGEVNRLPESQMVSDAAESGPSAVEQAADSPFAAAPSQPVAEVPAEIVIQPVPYEAPSDVEAASTAAPHPEPVPVRQPARPMSYQQLAGTLPGEAFAAVAQVQPSAELTAAAVEQRVEEAVAEPAARPMQAAAEDIVEQPAPAPVVPKEDPPPAIRAEREPLDNAFSLVDKSTEPPSSRWDPIPTLRPGLGWRDRPTPVPPLRGSSDPGNKRWLKTMEKEIRSTSGQWAAAVVPFKPGSFEGGPSQSASAQSAPVPSHAEVAEDSEPSLTRQWGLLSKFQQARLDSATRSAPAVGAGNEVHAAEPVAPGRS